MRERTTKKQQELYQYIAGFLSQHNYAPSYREIMTALNYKSVSTVAVHVDGLISKGYLTKSDKSARSIRLASESAASADKSADHLAWLKGEIASHEAVGADEKDVAILQQALNILEGKEEKNGV